MFITGKDRIFGINWKFPVPLIHGTQYNEITVLVAYQNLGK
jgi:hypothetical protein